MAVCPVTGSTFSGSFFAAVVVGVSEQAVRIARRAMAGRMDGLGIILVHAHSSNGRAGTVRPRC